MSAAPQKSPYAVIVGLGRTGLSCARYLHARGWRLAVTDTRTAPPELAALRALDAAIPVSLGALDTRLLPAWAGDHTGRQDVVKVLALSKANPLFVPYYWDQVGPLDDLYTQMANGVTTAKTALPKAAPQLQTKLDRAWKTWDAIK